MYKSGKFHKKLGIPQGELFPVAGYVTDADLFYREDLDIAYIRVAGEWLQFSRDNPSGYNNLVIGTPPSGYLEIDAGGDLVFEGNAGLQFGEIYVEGIDVGIELAAQDTYYQVIEWSPGGAGVDGESNGAVPDVTNDHITIAKAGKYLVHWTVSCYSAAKNEYEFEIFTNDGNTGYPNTETYRTTSVASAVGAISGTGICDFGVNDTVELWVERKDGVGVSKTITILASNIVVTQIGG